VGVGLELKIEPETIREALAGFGGVERRFQVRGEVEGITVVDDYGHHPAEIRATLRAAQNCRYSRVIVVFQPHRYSRTALLMDDFARCFVPCDHLLVMDIYPASEAPIEGVTSKALTDRMAAAGFSAVEYEPKAEGVVRKLLEIAQPGDLVITQGAGNVWQVGEQFLGALRELSRNTAGAAARGAAS
jgi:UDP-N-acetylmuramate--alanine ligase